VDKLLSEGTLKIRTALKVFFKFQA
jgi:hypothetical protein